MSDLERAEHWRQRAEELRVIAENMKTKDAKADLLLLAGELDHMADRLDATAWPTGSDERQS
ncbi:MAG TPA: hypothetical protein VF113_09715 [Stellaceae bacterium]